MNVNAPVFSLIPLTQSLPVVGTNKMAKTKSRKEAPKMIKPQSDKYETKFKTELCKSYCENGYCRYNDQCKFAHGLHELHVEQEDKKKQKNCKIFFA